MAWLGIVLSVPALRVVCGGGTDDGAGVPDGLPASAGVALQYIALAQAGSSSGLWPVAAGRVVVGLAGAGVATVLLSLG
ncbi:hypothetical protein [Streptomyces canus]|uniref:hypothetical protein n=1 Tax=Streptomyces canus TaxID=58343 RepID=UPI002E28A8BD|nr:hypothetical protein [Streptomyces canus]